MRRTVSETARPESSRNRLSLHDGWRIQHTRLVDAPPERVAAPGFPTRTWHPATVPTTVLNALVHDGTYPDPRIGMNLFRIPDACDAFNLEHDLARFSHIDGLTNPWKDPWWFRCAFDAPAGCGARQWLCFDALNYRADVWLNGEQLATAEEVVGAFLRYRFDVTGRLRPGAPNVLAVRVHIMDHVGRPGTQVRVFQRPRAHVAGENDPMHDVTFNIPAAGYDCSPHVPDRLMGLTDDVYLEFTGPVALRDPFVTTALPLPDTSRATLTVSAALVNAGDAPVEAVLRGAVAGEPGTAFEVPVTLAAGETRTVTLSGDDTPALRLDNPRLWWPLGYGGQPLYDLELAVEVDGATSDAERVRFGVRQVEKVLHAVDGRHGLRVHVNGRAVFCRGGYLQVDCLLDEAQMRGDGMEAQVRYLAEAGLNIVCIEDMPNLPERWLDLFDRYGLMLWNCFFQCSWLVRDDFPLDDALLERCARDMVLRYRNRACIVAWMCMNEGETREGPYRSWRRAVTELDGTRILIPTGYCRGNDAEVHPPWMDAEYPVGANDSRPKSYEWQVPSWYFDMVRNDPTWMFKIESGSATAQTFESLQRFMPGLRDGYRPDGLFPLDRVWAHHGANSYYRLFDAAIRRRLGEPATVRDYLDKGRLTAADQHRAMFDAVNHRKWDRTSGFMQWKLNAAWPTVQWQLYDYFLEPLVSLYVIKRACAPLYVQMAPDDHTVTVVNNGVEDVNGLRVTARLLAMDMTELHAQEATLDAPADAYREVFALPPLPPGDGVCFACLELRDAKGERVADNLYWLANGAETKHDAGCFAPLCAMPPARLACDWTARAEDGEGRVNVTLRNAGNLPALLVHQRLIDSESGEDVLPVFWDDDYLFLMPGQSRTTVARYPLAQAGPEAVRVALDAWRGVEPSA